MEVPNEKVSVNFNCPDCDHSEVVPVADFIDVGSPLCKKCLSEMDMGMVNISDANSC